MIRLKYYTKIFLFIVASSIFFSCNESNIGIFYGIETEVKLIDNSLSNDISIHSMAELNKKLYIGAYMVYEKSSDSEWRKLPSPSDSDRSTSIASNGKNIYAAYYNIDATRKGLFKLVGDSWTQVDTSSLNGSVEMVKSANNILFISTRISPNDGKLYYSNDGTSFIEIHNLIGSTFHVTYNGNTYWFANWYNIYKSSDPSSSGNISYVHSINHDRRITSLTPGFDSSYIYFSAWRVDSTNRKGYLYAINDSNVISEKNNPIDYVINGVKCFSIGNNYFILAATAGRGYYYDFNSVIPTFGTDIELERSKSNNILAQNYTSATDIHYSVANNFFMVDEPIGGIASGGDLYLMTVNSGLWKNSGTGGFRNWSIE